MIAIFVSDLNGRQVRSPGSIGLFSLPTLMRQGFNLISAIGILLFVSLGCAHMGDPCKNDLLKRVPSPDASHVVSVYSRQCPSALYTTVALEKPPNFLGKRGEVVCYLVEWGGKHPTVVEWNDSQNIFISTTDELTDLELIDAPKEICDNNIRIKYSIPGYPRPVEEAQALESVPDMFRLVLEDIGPCIDSYHRKGNSSSDIVADIERYARTGNEGLAVSLLIRFSNAARCDMSDKTTDRLGRLTAIYKQGPVRPLPPDDVTILPSNE